ncbi:MAG: FHA domain-containing protein [Bacteriovoracaceae bacterium]
MKIEVNYNNERSTEHQIDKDDVVVGRGKDCDIRVIADGVSRKHARIYKLGDKVMIEDLGSANGTFINNEKIQKAELTTFFPAFLGAIISLSLLDEDEIETATSSFCPTPSSAPSSIDDILNARAKTKVEKPSKNASKTVNSVTKKTRIVKTSSNHNSSFKYQVAAGLIFFIGSGVYFYQENIKNLFSAAPPQSKTIETENVEPESTNEDVAETKKDQETSSSKELCSGAAAKALCDSFKTQGKYGFYQKEKTLYGHINYKELLKKSPSVIKDQDKMIAYIYKGFNQDAMSSLLNADITEVVIDFIFFNPIKDRFLKKARVDLKSYFEQNKKDIVDTAAPAPSKKNSGKTFTNIDDFLNSQAEARKRKKKSDKKESSSSFADIQAKLKEHIHFKDLKEL